mmetsp:Transcript_25288/g.28045  ORF Transcript_25288/g.28045 Transcript_25288/m.28045 type:complete len:241 (+) Transcript_25288:27-749(+)
MEKLSIFGTSVAKPRIKCAGHGGCTSSIAQKKTAAKGKKVSSGIFRSKAIKNGTIFKKYYDRRDLPLKVIYKGNNKKIEWKADIELIDFNCYLPIFFHGLKEQEEPYKYLVDKGLDDLLTFGKDKILPVLPQLIIPIKSALSTKNHEVVCLTLIKLKKLVLAGEMIGESLVPYYRQILPVFNLLRHRNKNTGDKIDYGQKNGDNLGELIQETLEIFEKYGGEDAFINIKYMIPTYESCIY